MLDILFFFLVLHVGHSTLGQGYEDESKVSSLAWTQLTITIYETHTLCIKCAERKHLAQPILFAAEEKKKNLMDQ